MSIMDSTDEIKNIINWDYSIIKLICILLYTIDFMKPWILLDLYYFDVSMIWYLNVKIV